MIYFFFWVAFLVAVLLAVPIASLLEKRRYRAAHPAEVADDEAAGEEVLEAADEDLEDAADEGPPEFAEVEGGDDFSAFDDIK